jgi:hypothetical protein
MMNRIFGFVGVCAETGVLAGPDNDINIVALSSVAQHRLCQPILRDAVGVSSGLSFSLQLDMTLSLLIVDDFRAAIV